MRKENKLPKQANARVSNWLDQQKIQTSIEQITLLEKLHFINLVK